MMTTADCPRCGDTLTRHRHARRPGVFFWMCASKRHFCVDDNGAPGRVLDDKTAEVSAAPKDTCPTCREVTMRLESNKSPGRYFWVCEHKHYHADNDGAPGISLARH